MIVIAVAVAGAGIIGAVLWALGGQGSGPRATQRGAELAAAYCGLCHLQPEPEILPKRSWEAALGYMGFWLGIEDLGFLDDHPEFVRNNVASRHEVLLRDNVFPSAPALSAEDWAQLRSYYVASAPAAALPQTGKPPLEWQMSRFDVFRTSYRPVPAAVTTLVYVNDDAQEVYLGDSVMRALTVLGSDGRIKAAPRQFRPDITPIDLELVGDTAYLGSIGDLMSTLPSDARPAHIAALGLVNGSLASASSRVVVDELYRMADMKPADLNGDGELDFIVCGFGAVQGSVSWFEAQADGTFAEHVLLDRPGAVKAEVHDFNGDGLLDIAVLVADAREGMYILENRGGGEFTTNAIFETHPAYGHTYLELQDFDADGRMDLLVVNGDNVDSDPYNTRKNYHGIRIYLNRGSYVFEEAYFYPLYGAFVAKSADFDADGDLDIAAVAFYPDFEAERRESFVYLENDGDLGFSASTNDTVMSGRWMTMDIGDIDADDDIDVVLGGGYVPVGMFAYMDQFEALARTGPPALILKNTLR
ncbi:MAG TPA: VCBS repeat-containing protein [Gammaproteobacteria bacterium]|nr:VCBS repeat-containing protein [Gammaproteobacteria bacterium]